LKVIGEPSFAKKVVSKLTIKISNISYFQLPLEFNKEDLKIKILKMPSFSKFNNSAFNFNPQNKEDLGLTKIKG